MKDIKNWEPFQDDEEESICVQQWNHYLDTIKTGNYFPNNMWALKSNQFTYWAYWNQKQRILNVFLAVLDSSGKVIDGIFSGHAGAYGNIYECLDVYAKNDSSNIGEIRWEVRFGICNPIYCYLKS